VPAQTRWNYHLDALFGDSPHKALSNFLPCLLQDGCVPGDDGPANLPSVHKNGSASRHGVRLPSIALDRLGPEDAFVPALSGTDLTRRLNVLKNVLSLFGGKHSQQSLHGQEQGFGIPVLQVRSGQKIRADHFQAIAP